MVTFLLGWFALSFVFCLGWAMAGMLLSRGENDD